jgi:hypothetical protein
MKIQLIAEKIYDEPNNVHLYMYDTKYDKILEEEYEILSSKKEDLLIPYKFFYNLLFKLIVESNDKSTNLKITCKVCDELKNCERCIYTRFNMKRLKSFLYNIENVLLNVINYIVRHYEDVPIIKQIEYESSKEWFEQYIKDNV